MELYLIQHGLTDWNTKRISQGHVNVPLNEIGLQQAEELARYLGDQKFDAIYSSDLSRTLGSIEPLAKKIGLKVNADWRLREGRWPHQRKGNNEYETLPFFSVESETHEDVLNRLVTILEEVITRHPEGRVIIMTHGSVLTRLIFHLEGFSKWPFPPCKMQKMAVNILRLNSDSTWDAVTLNDSDYLQAKGLLVGRVRRRRRRRVIVHSIGVFCRRFLPSILHPHVQQILRKSIDKDRKLATNPYHEMEHKPEASLSNDGFINQ